MILSSIKMYADVGIKHVTLPVLAVAMVIGNGMLIHVTLTHKRLRTVTNYLVLSLAVSDLLVGSVVVPLMVTAEEGVFGASSSVCLYVFSVAIALVLVSCLTLMAIAVERYIAISRPLRHHALMTPRNVFLVITMVWIYAGIVGCLPLLGWNAVQNNSVSSSNNYNISNISYPNMTFSLVKSTNREVFSAPDCRYQNVMAGSFVAFMYPGHFIPLWIMLIVLYGRIYLRSRNQTCRENVRRWSRSLQARRYSAGRMRENWRALRILAIVVGYFLFSWMPVVIWYCLLYRGFSVETVHNIQPTVPYWFYNLGITLAFGNSAVNPYLYGFGNRSVRTAWIKCIRDSARQVYSCYWCGIGQFLYKNRENKDLVPQENNITPAATPLGMRYSQKDRPSSRGDLKTSQPQQSAQV